MSRQKDDWQRYCELRERFFDAYPNDPVSPELESLILGDTLKKRDFVSHLHLQAALAVSDDFQPISAAKSGHNPMLIDSVDTHSQVPVELPRQSLWMRTLLWSASVTAVALWFGLIYAEIHNVTVQLESPIATLYSATDCRWGESSLPTTVGSDLFSGRMQLLSGTARLEIQNTSLTLQGPADFELISQDRCKLHRGRVLLESVNGGDGLVILVPNGAIADFGAEIGVNVSEAGDAELHVFSGFVKAKHCGLGKSLEASESDDIRIQPDAIRKLEKNSRLIGNEQPIARSLTLGASQADRTPVSAVSLSS